MALADALGPDTGIHRDLVERIVELGQTRHGRRLSFAAAPDAEVIFDIRAVGQFGSGAIDGQQAKTVPCLRVEMFVEEVVEFFVQLPEGFVS